jgi:hypothetical protein
VTDIVDEQQALGLFRGVLDSFDHHLGRRRVQHYPYHRFREAAPPHERRPQVS